MRKTTSRSFSSGSSCSSSSVSGPSVFTVPSRAFALDFDPPRPAPQPPETRRTTMLRGRRGITGTAAVLTALALAATACTGAGGGGGHGAADLDVHPGGTDASTATGAHHPRTAPA